MPSQSLEQEALDRVARMYSSFDRNPHPHPAEPPPEPEPEKPEPVPPKAEEKPAGLLDVLLKDKEQSLLMLLLVILMKDGADMQTVLALMYILL